MLVADMPEEVQALCTAVVWRAPFEPIEAILSYQLEFVSDYEDFTISHQSHDRIYLTTQQEKSPGTLVRVSMVHSYIVKSAPPPPSRCCEFLVIGLPSLYHSQEPPPPLKNCMEFSANICTVASNITCTQCLQLWPITVLA